MMIKVDKYHSKPESYWVSGFGGVEVNKIQPNPIYKLAFKKPLLAILM